MLPVALRLVTSVMGSCRVQVFLPTIPFSLFWLSISPWTPAWVDVLAATSAALVAMSQQFHGWAHTRKSHLPAAVIALQVTSIDIINAVLMLHELFQDMCCTRPDPFHPQLPQHIHCTNLAVSSGMGSLHLSKNDNPLNLLNHQDLPCFLRALAGVWCPSACPDWGMGSRKDCGCLLSDAGNELPEPFQLLRVSPVTNMFAPPSAAAGFTLKALCWAMLLPVASTCQPAAAASRVP